MGERLAAALLPTLLHRVNNTTQLIVGVRALAGLEPLSLPERCASDLTRASGEAHEQGWLLGVLAGALGADLLLAREERDGLRPTLALVRDALRRDGRELKVELAEVPRIGGDATAPGSAELCAALAALVCEAGGGGAGSEALALAFAASERFHELRCDGGCTPGLRATFDELGLEPRGCALLEDPPGWTLRMPAAWLSFGT